MKGNRVAAVCCLAMAAFAQDRRGNTPLMQAVLYDSPATVKALLDKGADPNARNAFAATALILGAGDEEKARLLIAKGADANARSRMGRTPLMIAAACDGCSAVVKLLLAKGADPKAKDNGGITALHLAAATGDSASVRLLLDAGADVNAATPGGLTPLMQSLTICDLESVRLMLAHHADVHAANTSGGEVKFGPIQLVKLTPLHFAAPYCSKDVVQTLLDAGAEVDARDIRGMTPLMLSVASETQDAAVVRVLIHAGADNTAKSKDGETALNWALKYNNKDVVSQLLAAGSYPPPHSILGPATHDPKRRTEAAAVGLSTGLLQRTAAEFFRQSGCVGCHHQTMTLAAVAAARAAHVPVDETGARDLVKMVESEWTGQQEALTERSDPGGLADGEVYALWALSRNNYPPGPLTDTIAVHVAALQHRDGRWHVGDASRSPIQESEIARTARGLYALKAYGPAGRRAEFADRIARAGDWIAHAIPVTNDDLAMQMVGLFWAGAPADQVRALGVKLLAAQQGDGGWAQSPGLLPDAYATGESLWALLECGVANPNDAAWRRGIDYLLTNQQDDGSWLVRSRAPRFQPYFQSGFPYEHNQWVSAAGTAWATIALAATIPKQGKPIQ